MPHVDVQPFSWDVVREAAEWLEDAIYAVRHHEEASKDPGIEFCSGWCGYYLSCRALDRKIEGGLIEDEDLTQLKTPEVVLRRDTAGQFVFHHLDIQPAFFTSVLRALGRSVDAIDDSLKQDPRYSL